MFGWGIWLSEIIFWTFYNLFFTIDAIKAMTVLIFVRRCYDKRKSYFEICVMGTVAVRRPGKLNLSSRSLMAETEANSGKPSERSS